MLPLPFYGSLSPLLFQITTTVAGLTGADVVKCSRDVLIKPDKALVDVKNQSFDIIVLPGGLGGSDNLSKVGNPWVNVTSWCHTLG